MGGLVKVVANRSLSIMVVLCLRVHSSALSVAVTTIALIPVPHLKNFLAQLLQLVLHLHINCDWPSFLQVCVGM